MTARGDASVTVSHELCIARNHSVVGVYRHSRSIIFRFPNSNSKLVQLRMWYPETIFFDNRTHRGYRKKNHKSRINFPVIFFNFFSKVQKVYVVTRDVSVYLLDIMLKKLIWCHRTSSGCHRTSFGNYRTIW